MKRLAIYLAGVLSGIVGYLMASYIEEWWDRR